MLLKHKVVSEYPESFENNVLYIFDKLTLCIHLCACGCGLETVTPISVTDWELRTRGTHVSLYNSIGNYAFPCKSHYWIIESKVVWADSPQGLLVSALVNAGVKDGLLNIISRFRPPSIELKK